MLDKRAVQIGAVMWATAGLLVAAVSLAAIETDALVLVGIASLVFPGCAAAAALAVARGHLRMAGVLLLLSVATPTYFAWVLNLPALVMGAALVVAPRRTVRSSPADLSHA